MIPKVIHYCWFGAGRKPKIFEQCLLSWEEYCPDYKMIEWNEKNSLRFFNSFYNDALRKKKYAFVSDYIRAKVLYEFGGIYLDTDMLLLKPIDELLSYDFFSGFEVEERVAYGLFGGHKKHRFFFEMIKFYSETEFDEFSPPIITHIFKYLIKADNIDENEILLSQEYFYPLTYENRGKDYELFTTEKTYGVHLWDHSWKEEKSESIFNLLKKIKIVLIDFIFYGYSKKYLKRYLKEFLRKIYLRLKKLI
jgi:mannosyltransferase OCH1-like enzyme